MATIALSGKKASATVFVTNLVVVSKLVLFMTAYGPTQEIRAFAQLLMEGADAEVQGNKFERFYGLTGRNVRFVPQMGNGYGGAFIVPDESSNLLIANSQKECFDIFSRILDQRWFVHRDWYETMFSKIAVEIPPQVGNKSCWSYAPGKIERFIAEGLICGAFTMPPATAHLTLEVKEDKDKNAR